MGLRGRGDIDDVIDRSSRLRRSQRTRWLSIAVIVAALSQHRPSRADDMVAALATAGAIGAASAVPAIVNGIAAGRRARPGRFWVIAGYVLGPLAIASGVAIAALAGRIVESESGGVEQSPAPLYGAAGGLVAIGLVTLAVTAYAELFSVQRVLLTGLLDRDAAGRLYAGVACRVHSW